VGVECELSQAQCGSVGPTTFRGVAYVDVVRWWNNYGEFQAELLTIDALGIGPGRRPIALAEVGGHFPTLEVLKAQPKW